MNREIKFRGHSEHGWVYGDLWQEYSDHKKIGKVTILHSKVYVPVDPKTVGQYTGHKDKNGTEIYGGDIVNNVIYKNGTRHVGQIVFDYNGWCIKTKDKSLPLDLPEKLNIIGNIHQNPELMEKV